MKHTFLIILLLFSFSQAFADPIKIYTFNQTDFSFKDSSRIASFDDTVGNLPNWLEAIKGDPVAQEKLAGQFFSGNGAPLDKVEAIKWYRILACQGNQTAQKIVAAAFETGEGVPLNLENAIIWYSRLAQQGDVLAKDKIPVLQKRMQEPPPPAPTEASTPQSKSNQKPKIVSINLQAAGVFFEKSDSDEIQIEKNLDMSQVSYSEDKTDSGVKITSEMKNPFATNAGFIKLKLPDNCIIIFKSMSGAVNIKGINCASIMINTMSGEIEADSLVTSDASLETMSGSIMYKGKVTEGKHVLSSMSGPVVMFLDSSSDVAIDLYSEKAFVSFGQEQHRQSYKKVLNSGSGKILAKTISSSVKCFVH